MQTAHVVCRYNMSLLLFGLWCGVDEGMENGCRKKSLCIDLYMKFAFKVMKQPSLSLFYIFSVFLMSYFLYIFLILPKLQFFYHETDDVSHLFNLKISIFKNHSVFSVLFHFNYFKQHSN